MKSIMEKIATDSLEEERLEGQRILDESLKKARDDFDSEKAEAIIKVTLEHEKKQKIREEQLEAQHRANVEKITLEWEEKLKVTSTFHQYSSWGGVIKNSKNGRRIKVVNISVLYQQKNAKPC